MVRLENVATPPTALTVVTPPSVEPPGFAPTAIETGALNVVARLLFTSRALTTTAVSVVPAVAETGCVVITSCDADAGNPVAVNVTEGSPLTAAVSVFVPAVTPSVQEPTLATPALSV